jgi:hypothetical protein
MDQSKEDDYSWSKVPSNLPHCPNSINNQTQNGDETGDREDAHGQTSGVHCFMILDTIHLSFYSL